MTVLERILELRDERGWTEYRLSDIIYIERNLRTTTVFCKEEDYKTSESIDIISEKINSQNFTRCHKSFLVNMNFIKELKRNSYILTNGAEIPISRSFSSLSKTDFSKFICNKN